MDIDGQARQAELNPLQLGGHVLPPACCWKNSNLARQEAQIRNDYREGAPWAVEKGL